MLLKLQRAGAIWKRQRRMLQPGFSPKRMDGYCTLMMAATEKALSTLPDSPAFDLEFSHWSHQVTMDVILRTLFGLGDASVRDQAIAAVATLSETGMEEMYWPMSLPDWMPHKRGKRRAKRVLSDMIQSRIAARRDLQGRATPDGGSHDILSMLLNVRDEDGQGDGLSHDEVRDQCMTIFLAGHETTALSLSWWAWLIGTHPQAAQKARAEVDACLAGRAPTYQDLESLRYLSWTFKEALRLYPPAPGLLARRSLRDIRLGEWIIPKGAMLRITPWAIHRDERWFEAPLSFNPERFDEATPLPHRQAYMPFGTGPRNCIGSHFAMTEMTLMAARLLQTFDFECQAIPHPKLKVLLFPEGGVPLSMRRRIFQRDERLVSD